MGCLVLQPSAESVNAFLIGVLCSFAPGVLFIIVWVSGNLRAQERHIETEQRANARARRAQ